MNNLRLSAQEMKKPTTLVISALLIALYIVLDQFTIQLSATLHVSFKFVSVALAGYFFGGVVGMYVGGISDIVGFLLYPKGPFLAGFTVSAIITGLIYGMAFYNKKLTVMRSVIAHGLVAIFVDLLLNTFWLYIIYGKGMYILLIERAPKQIIFPFIAIIFYIIAKLLKPIFHNISKR